MPSRKPGILSFFHGIQFPLKEVRKKLGEHAGPGKKLGLEITKSELEKYKKIWSRSDFQTLFKKIRNEKTFSLKGIDTSFFSIATLAKRKGIEIVPLDSPDLLKRAGELGKKVRELGKKLDNKGIIKYDPVHFFQRIKPEKVKELEKTNPKIAKTLAEYNKA